MPSRPIATTALLTTIALWLVGCSSSETASDDNVPLVQAVAKIDHEAWGKLGYRLDWQGFPFAGSVRDPSVSLLTPAAQFVLVQEKGSNVSLLETNTGARRWTVEFGGRLTRFVGLDVDPQDPNRILISAESELFTVAASNGTISNREKFDKVVNTAPVFTGGLAIYGTSIGEVLAHRPGATLKAWGYGTTSAIDANPAKLNDSVGVVTQGGEVLFFTTGGNVVGRNRIFGSLSTNPVSNGSYLAVASLDQSLWCFDERGTLVWRLRTPAPLQVQPTAVENAVVCELPDRGLTSVELATGTILWSNKKVHGTVLATNGSRLLVWDGSTASLVDSARGDVLASTPLPGITSITTDQFNAGNLYAATAEGSIAKFRLRH